MKQGVLHAIKFVETDNKLNITDIQGKAAAEEKLSHMVRESICWRMYTGLQWANVDKWVSLSRVKV
jgi:hypothetical protein